MSKYKILAPIMGLLLITGLPFVFQNGNDGSSKRDVPPSIGNVNALKAQYNRWKADYVKYGGDNQLGLKLGYFKGFSKEYTSATGSIIVDLENGKVSAVTSGLPENEQYDVWFVANNDGGSVLPGGSTYNGQQNIIPDELCEGLQVGDVLDNDEHFPVVYRAPSAG